LYRSSLPDREGRRRTARWLWLAGAIALGAAVVLVLILALAPGGVGPGPKLRWAPPALDHPTTISAADADTGSDSDHVLNLDPGRDYRVQMPSGPLTGKGGLTIQGGRNVVLIGGEIDVPPQPGPSPSPESRRGLYLSGQTGTVHVEGLLIRGSGLSEGIDLSEPDAAAVQIENVRVENVHARDERNFSDNHPDVIQTWAGPAELRVDRLTGSTDYQGLFLAPNQYGSQPPPRQVAISHVDLTGTRTPERCGCYLLWQSGSFPIQTSDLYLTPHPGDRLSGTQWPSPAPWGEAISGSPPDGPFVPSGRAGSSYRSPGYAGQR
jgi:hypothetical protein